MPKFIGFIILVAVAFFGAPAATMANFSTESTGRPLRVAIIGLVHGHVAGFLGTALKRSDIQIVGIAEPDQQLAQRYLKQFKLDSQLLYSDVEQMLVKVQPQALLVYTDTRDHRRVVEAATRHRVPVMMEKPLAVSVEDAMAIKRAADEAHIPVLVNYETTWYPSNTAVYHLVRQGSLGDVRKVVVHDGHKGAKGDRCSSRVSLMADRSSAQRRGSAVRLRLLWRRPHDLADGGSDPDYRYRCYPTTQT